MFRCRARTTAAAAAVAAAAAASAYHHHRKKYQCICNFFSQKRTNVLKYIWGVFICRPQQQHNTRVSHLLPSPNGYTHVVVVAFTLNTVQISLSSTVRSPVRSYISYFFVLLVFAQQGRPKFERPVADVNAPDLYVPLMSFITFVLLTGYAKGSAAALSDGAGTFSPEVRGMRRW